MKIRGGTCWSGSRLMLSAVLSLCTNVFVSKAFRYLSLFCTFWFYFRVTDGRRNVQFISLPSIHFTALSQPWSVMSVTTRYFTVLRVVELGMVEKSIFRQRFHTIFIFYPFKKKCFVQIWLPLHKFICRKKKERQYRP